MSTRCRIAKQLDEDKYKSIYSHWDGYPDGVGATLKKYYTDPDKIDKLLDLGDISSLGAEVDPDPDKVHTYDNPQDDVTVAYRRDRGEVDASKAVVSDSFDDLENLCTDCWAEYLYIYGLDKKWKTYDLLDGGLIESDSFFGKVKKNIKESQKLTEEEFNDLDSIRVDIASNINAAIDEYNSYGGDISFSFNSYDDDFNKLVVRASAIGNDPDESFDRLVFLKPNGVSQEAFYEALDEWATSHNSPDSFYEAASAGKFSIKPNKSDDIWLDFSGAGISGSAKVYNVPSYYGIKNSNISKLSYRGKDKCNYDRGWDVVPKDIKLLDSLCKELISYRINNLYEVDDYEVEDIQSENNDYNYDSETHNFDESEKLKEADKEDYKQKFIDYCKDKLVDSLGTVEVETDDWDSEEADAKKTVSVNVVATQEIRDFGDCKILDDEDLFEKLDNDSGNLGFVKADGEFVITPMITSYGLMGRLQFDKITKDFYSWILDSWDEIYMDEYMDDIKESEKLKEAEWHTWVHDDPSTTYGFKNQYGYTINQLQIDDEAKEYRVGSFTQSNDKTITRKKFYQMIEELEAAGYKKVEYWSNRQGAGSNTSNIINEADGSKEYTLVNADSDKISELEDGSAFTWEGMSIDDKNLKDIVEALKEETPIKLPVTFYTWKGKDFNEKYGLTDSNAYPDNLDFLSISLDNWSEMGNLPFWKMSVGARWLDDIVDNNARRQGSGSTEDDEEE